MSLGHIIYTSKATLPLDPASKRASLISLLASARIFNEEHKLSGYLTLVDNQFLQILEGDSAALNKVMTRIETDSRNTDIVVRERANIDGKMFEDWSMGCSLDPEMLRNAMTFAGLQSNADFQVAPTEALTTFLVMLSNMSNRHGVELQS